MVTGNQIGVNWVTVVSKLDENEMEISKKAFNEIKYCWQTVCLRWSQIRCQTSASKIVEKTELA